jgi:hypothetical protein
LAGCDGAASICPIADWEGVQGEPSPPGEDKHFSAVRRALVLKENVVAGEFVVHVTAYQGGFKNTGEFEQKRR